MAQVVFQLLSGGERMGKEIDTGDDTTIRPGHLVKLDTTGSSVSLNTVNNLPFGIAYGLRYSQYRPTTPVFGADEPLSVVWGVGEVLLSSDFFTGGSLPAAGDDLYAQAGGLWGMQGAAAAKVGDCIARRTSTEAIGGTGSSLTVAHCRFNIQP